MLSSVEVTFDLPGVAIAVIRHPDPIDRELLTEAERAIFESLTTDKRRREWFAGRLAARAALRSLGLPHASVLRDPEGRPITDGAYVAITHGDSIAAAAASLDLHVGIDVIDPQD